MCVRTPPIDPVIMKGIMQMIATVLTLYNDNDHGDADGDNDDQQCGGYDDDDADPDAC